GSRALWSMGAVLYDRLTPVQSLSANQSLKSPNHQYDLIMQGDGNLVIYRSGGGAVWSATTSGANTLVMQGDGNLVIYRSGGVAVWSSGTAGKAGAYVRIQDDGNLVIYQGSAAVWASNATPVPAGWACYSTYNQACVSQFGYTGQSTWGYQGDPWGNNCTNYAAFRLDHNGARNPGSLGNADKWAVNARNKGLTVNQTTAVGAIAQWNSQHVAYIDWVSSDGNQIAISETSFGGTFNGKTYTSSSGRRVLTRGVSGWPDNIIHF
ncbi:MAG: CHAP domain-containing protein, partial [Actinomycetota bacterium]